MELLKQNGLLENSMVVIFGDHDGLFKRDQDEIEELFARKKLAMKNGSANTCPYRSLSILKDYRANASKPMVDKLIFFLPFAT